MSTDTVEKIDLDLSLIVIDPDLQPREVMKQETITQYAEDMLAGIEFEPIRVFRVTDRDGRYFVTSGFHRYHGAKEAGFEAIHCELFDGTYAEAKWDAAGSNVEWDTVGIKRSNADKRRAVEMALEAHPSDSSNAIAKQAGVSHPLVLKIRESLTCNITRKVPTFNQTNEMVDWAKWTWNPVTGCEHTCVYCYARDIANRFYPEKFKPTFHPDRLDAPRNTKLPGKATEETVGPIERIGWKNVFVCSMADLFGRWVPDEWIDGVFDSCRQSPEWNYLFLTKFPQRYIDLDFPETSWVGTSIDEQKRVANAEKAFSKLKVPVRWLSVEPMREPIKFNDMSMFDWVVVGGQSKSTGAPEFFPEPDWVVDLIYHARQAGCKVYCKPNTDPSGLWSGIYEQYPSVFEVVP